jgi:Heterokaryon incompatibility protein (HET)
MDTYDFRDAPEYEALSYNWGKHDGSSNIKLNNLQFQVTPNLLATLQQPCLNQAKNSKSKKRYGLMQYALISQMAQRSLSK